MIQVMLLYVYTILSHKTTSIFMTNNTSITIALPIGEIVAGTNTLLLLKHNKIHRDIAENKLKVKE